MGEAALSLSPSLSEVPLLAGRERLGLPCPECLALLQAALNELLAAPWHCRRLSPTASITQGPGRTTGLSLPK